MGLSLKTQHEDRTLPTLDDEEQPEEFEDKSF